MQPFLTKYAVPRTEAPKIPGHYCNATQMWVVQVDGLNLPIIEYNQSLVALSTKTEGQQEQDDQVDAPSILDIITKTANQQEQDDEQNLSHFCLDLLTKTDNNTESDDNSLVKTEMLF